MKSMLLNAVYAAHADEDGVAMAMYRANKPSIKSWGETLPKSFAAEFVLLRNAMRTFN